MKGATKDAARSPTKDTVKGTVKDAMLTADDRDRLANRLTALGHDFGEEPAGQAVSALLSYVDLFLTWNARINLGGVLTPDQLVDQHIRDAFAAVHFLSPDEGIHRVIDVGTGGGLPAIPMAVLRPRVNFELFEPTGKKAAFLRTVVRALGLGSRVRINASRVERIHASRVERVHVPRVDQSETVRPDPGPDRLAPGSRPTLLYDLAFSRATLAPADWLSLGLTLVRPSGWVLVFATAAEPTAGSVPDRELAYAANRRILAYRRGEG